MRRLLLALLPIATLLSACSSTDYDLVNTASISPRFHDTDPQDFGGRTPHRHSIHGIDISKWNGNIDWARVKNSGVSFAFLSNCRQGSEFHKPRMDLLNNLVHTAILRA